jgi:hypothetical protein
MNGRGIGTRPSCACPGFAVPRIIKMMAIHLHLCMATPPKASQYTIKLALPWLAYKRKSGLST